MKQNLVFDYLLDRNNPFSSIKTFWSLSQRKEFGQSRESARINILYEYKNILLRFLLIYLLELRDN